MSRSKSVSQAGHHAELAADEAGADNKPQMVIPGSEKAGVGKLAQPGADAALKPRVAQQATDDGLFGDGSTYRANLTRNGAETAQQRRRSHPLD